MQIKRWGLMLAAALLFGGILGCGGKEGGSGDGEGSPVSSASTAADQAVTISTVMPVYPETKFRDGETIENNVFTRWAKEKFNIDFKFIWTVAGGATPA